MKQEVFEVDTWSEFKSKIRQLAGDGYILDIACYYDFGGIIVAHKVEPTSGKC